MKKALIMAALLAGCGSDGATAPEEPTLVGAWSVVSVNEEALPLRQDVVDGTGATCQVLLTRMELRFTDEARYAGLYDTSTECAEGTQHDQEHDNGGYRTAGDRVFLRNDNNPDAEGEMRFTFPGHNRLRLRDYSLGFGTNTFELERITGR